MTQFARYFLVLLTGLATFATSVMGGRVLCLDGPGHFALEAPHEQTGCPAACHDERPDHPADDGDGHGAPGGCNDFSSGVHLASDATSGLADLQHAQHFLPPDACVAPAVTPVSEPAYHRFDSAADPPAPGELARLGHIVLLI
jgi:hypothetical protein